MEIIRNVSRTGQEGFTLIELLVVIAIIAVLMVVVLVTLNPAELLRQSRDSNRLSDMATLKTALSLYQSDGLATTTGSLGVHGICYIDGAATTTCAGWFPTTTSTSTTSTRTVAGAGWIPVSFNLISFGTPLTQLPIDPVNNASYFYSYAASGTSLFKLAMRTESVKFSASGTADVESTDGGTSTSMFETGPGTSVL